MTVLNRLLRELADTRGPIRLDDLARTLGVQRSALEGMLDVLQQKGLLGDQTAGAHSGDARCASGCASTCVGVGACPFMAGVPHQRWVHVRLPAAGPSVGGPAKA